MYSDSLIVEPDLSDTAEIGCSVLSAALQQRSGPCPDVGQALCGLDLKARSRCGLAQGIQFEAELGDELRAKS